MRFFFSNRAQRFVLKRYTKRVVPRPSGTMSALGHKPKSIRRRLPSAYWQTSDIRRALIARKRAPILRLHAIASAE